MNAIEYAKRLKTTRKLITGKFYMREFTGEDVITSPLKSHTLQGAIKEAVKKRRDQFNPIDIYVVNYRPYYTPIVCEQYCKNQNWKFYF